MNNQSYYAVLPANVRYDNTLKPNEKLLYAEISALCNKEGRCWASNKYFGELYGVRPETISRWISKLKKRKYISVKTEIENGLEVRYLSVVVDCFPGSRGVDQKVKGGVDKKVKHNNNISTEVDIETPTQKKRSSETRGKRIRFEGKTAEERETSFKLQIKQAAENHARNHGKQPERDELIKFFRYWSEPDDFGKMRAEREKTWSTSGRLATWLSNNFRTKNERKSDRL